MPCGKQLLERYSYRRDDTYIGDEACADSAVAYAHGFLIAHKQDAK
jgi:hypothetical protein